MVKHVRLETELFIQNNALLCDRTVLLVRQRLQRPHCLGYHRRLLGGNFRFRGCNTLEERVSNLSITAGHNG